MAFHKYDLLFKILMIGDNDLEKKDFVLTFINDGFSLSSRNLTSKHISYFNQHFLSYIAIGIDFKIKAIDFQNIRIKLQIWDTAGESRFRTITKTYYKGAHGIILLYDVTDQNSFKNIRNWIKQIEANAQNNIAKVLVGSNSHLPNREVSEDEGKKLAEQFNIAFFETSTKINQNINEVFYYLTEEIININSQNF